MKPERYLQTNQAGALVADVDGQSALRTQFDDEKGRKIKMNQPIPSSAARAQLGVETFGRNEAQVGRNEAHSSGVSWAAVIAGAFVAAALSLALLALGTGIGFSSASPWASAGATRIGRTAIAWLIVTQLIASSLGGYLAGRLRTRWVSIHTHEVYFRDTAHGFLVWAVGLVMTTAFLTSAATSLTSGAVWGDLTAASRSESLRSSVGSDSNRYLVDQLLRTAAPSSDQDNASVRDEVGLIVANSLREVGLSQADKSYLTQVVAARTGVSQSDAGRRVDEAYAQAQQVADRSRKAVAHSMYWTFAALLIGAFCASVAATIGGRQRDRVALV
jgi:hypothetical protein